MPFAYLMLALLHFFSGAPWLGWTLIVLAGLSVVAHRQLPIRTKPSRRATGALLLASFIGFATMWYGLHSQVLPMWLGGLVLVIGVDGVISFLSWRSWRGQLTSTSLRAGSLSGT